MNFFVYVYHGIIAVIYSFLNLCRYFYLGLKYLPNKIINILSNTKKQPPKKKSMTKTSIKTDTPNKIIKTTKNEEIFPDIKQKDFENEDALLVQSKKDEKQRLQAEDKQREKQVIKTEKELKKAIKNNETMLKKEKQIKKKNLFQKKPKEINMPELVIDFSGPDAVKTEKKMTYQYLIKTPEGKIVKDYFTAYSKAEVYSFLKSEGNTVYEIKTDKWINFAYSPHSSSAEKFKTKDLIFFITQLSTYLKAGISLSESCRILVKQFKQKKYQRILKAIVYDLSIGLSFSEAMLKQGKAFPMILINMVKTAEMTGELPEVLDDMEEYFTEIESTRKAMITAMIYPVIIFIIAIGVGTFIMLYVVPKFVDIYNTMDNAELPGITKFVLWLSDFLQNYILIIGVATVGLIALFIYLYKNIIPFKKTVQWILMHLPVFKNVIIYNEVTTFTKTFSSLLAHNVFITDSMDILNKITSNEIYKELIYEAIKNVSVGKNVSLAFKDHWAFPIPAYEMIVTGEKTGQLSEMMQKVSAYYQDLHKNSVARIKTFVEPAMIIMLTGMVGVIVLSIVIPMFSMYSQIQA